MTKRLVVIDGKSVFYRGYYAMPGLATHDGTPTGGVFGFITLALEVMKRLQPDYVAVAWDKRGTNIRRRVELLPTYKAGRTKAPDDFYAQIPILHELLDALSWPLYELDDYEADDIMGSLAKQASEQGIETDLVTSDLDLLQVIGPRVRVYALKKGLSSIEEFDEGYFEGKYGLKVGQFLDFKALRGDSSDNIPGVPGIGEKTATSLLKDYGTLDGIYAHLEDIAPSLRKKLEAGRESAYLSKDVAAIWLDAPLPLDLEGMDARHYDTQRLRAILKKLEFSSLERRLPEYVRPTAGGETAAAVGAPQQAMLPDLPELAPWPGLTGQPIDAAVLHLDDTTVYLRAGQGPLWHGGWEAVSAEDWEWLAGRPVAVWDGKELYRQLYAHGVEITLGTLHDVRQAAFLIDPLARDRRLPALAGFEVDPADPRSVVAALGQAYGQQVRVLAAMPRVAAVARTLDFPLARVLARMEARGIRIDQPFLAQLSQRLGDELVAIDQAIYTHAGYEFNISSPSQLADVLYKKLLLPTGGIKRGKTGLSTGQKELDKLRGLHPIIELIEKSRELSKLKSTYIDALPKLADDRSRLHTTLTQDVAATGRLSSLNPNLQNIPVRTELGRKIRQAFTADDGNVLVSADYSQFELRLAAVLAGDQLLIDAFNKGVDIHTQTASDVYGVPRGEVTKAQRRAAKIINFGVLYGMSPHGLSAAAGMSFGEAKDFISRYFELRAPIRRYIDETLKKAETDGYVETYFGRRRPTPDIKSSNFVIREAAKRAAANMPIQGTEADLMKLAMLRVEDTLGGAGRQILQIHDSILVECPEENAAQVTDILKATMEAVAPELPVRLAVETSSGKTWAEL